MVVYTFSSLAKGEFYIYKEDTLDVIPDRPITVFQKIAEGHEVDIKIKFRRWRCPVVERGRPIWVPAERRSLTVFPLNLTKCR